MFLSNICDIPKKILNHFCLFLAIFYVFLWRFRLYLWKMAHDRFDERHSFNVLGFIQLLYDTTCVNSDFWVKPVWGLGRLAFSSLYQNYSKTRNSSVRFTLDARYRVRSVVMDGIAERCRGRAVSKYLLHTRVFTLATRTIRWAASGSTPKINKLSCKIMISPWYVYVVVNHHFWVLGVSS